MLTHIPNVLTEEQLQAALSIIARNPFVDGRQSAGKMARQVKRNTELSADAGELSKLNNIVMGSLVQNPLYRSAAIPQRIATPYYARYTEGMEYGDHVDDPVMGAGNLYRSDVSVTVFLSEPHGYEGGELVINTSFGEREVKLPAGDAVIYPSSSVHRVSRVTSGERIVAVTWVQSLIRDAEKRALLHDLNQAREYLLVHAPGEQSTVRVNTSYINLFRMWAEV
jgi:PKHD-type hydroxylase